MTVAEPAPQEGGKANRMVIVISWSLKLENKEKLQLYLGSPYI